MNMSVTYSGRTYSVSNLNHSNDKCSLTISKSTSRWSDTIYLNFNLYVSPPYGFLSKEGNIGLSKRQAIEMAIAILSYCQQTEEISEPSPLTIEFNDNNFIDKFDSKITIQELASLIDVEEDLIVKEAQKISSWGVLSSDTHISLVNALKIRDNLSKKLPNED